MKQHAREFFHLPPARGHRIPALRVAAGIVIPLIALVLLGRADLTIYAVFGALTGVYGRMEPHWLRLKHQTYAGILMCASVAGGVALAAAHASAWALTGLATILAGVLSVVSDRLSLRPSGPFFYLFAFTASASVPFDGQLWEAATTAAASVAVALLIGFAGRLRAHRHHPDRGLLEDPHAPWPRMLRHAGRYVAAMGLAGSLATALGLGHSYWAMIAAAAPIAAADATRGLVRAVHRVVGTYGGVALTAGLLTLHWAALPLAVLLAGLQFIGEVFVVRHYSIALVFMTPVALMMTGFVAASPSQGLVADRAVETTIGAAIAFAVILLTTSRRRSGAAGAPASPARVLAEHGPRASDAG
ncbi:FUSC family protein [Sinomonas sp. P10A9]|uniref:FUSC family protein n=1 Tax=Sinomonas puerhi TaxID=3238584 RepID=A0AB39L3K4_9MICC